MAQVAIGTRLASYGLAEATTPLEDLQVTGTTTYALSASNQAAAKRMHVLRPSSLDDLKKWIGLPSTAAAPTHVSSIASVLPRNAIANVNAAVDLRKALPATLTRDHVDALYAAAHQYVMTNNHGLEATAVGNVNKWLVALKPQIIVWLYRDIHVAAGAKLLLNTSHSVLFARHIEVEKTGQIQVKAAITKIDCAGFKGH
jgi:hypothetical protein